MSAGATAAAGGVYQPIEFVTGKAKLAASADPEDASTPSLGASWGRLLANWSGPARLPTPRR